MARQRSVLTIGSFDGVHRAHAAIIRQVQAEAKSRGCRAIALSFDPHPAVTLRPEEVPSRLTTFETRRELLLHAGAGEVIRLEPTKALLDLEPDQFLAGLVEQYAPAAIVEGPDFSFGRGRSGSIQTLRDFGSRHDFSLIVHEPLETALTDHTLVRISSTMVRWLLSHGRVQDAAILLDRDYFLTGTVTRGDQRGRTIGYPTANIDTECLIPGDGVYAGWAALPSGHRFPAAISIGTKPTFGPHARTLEAFLLDPAAAAPAPASLPLQQEYGWAITLSFSHWIRDQAAFGSLPALLEQMNRDCRRVLSLTSQSPPSSLTGCAACP